ncbi:hypothetical protein M758_4G223700 [Ceratodon purpureus]|nr:hypothetical protein M758_4G223700 [Ceratodon purpureus]
MYWLVAVSLSWLTNSHWYVACRYCRRRQFRDISKLQVAIRCMPCVKGAGPCWVGRCNEVA